MSGRCAIFSWASSMGLGDMRLTTAPPSVINESGTLGIWAEEDSPKSCAQDIRRKRCWFVMPIGGSAMFLILGVAGSWLVAS